MNTHNVSTLSPKISMGGGVNMSLKSPSTQSPSRQKTKKSPKNKIFAPVISLVLSAFFLPFSGQLKAADCTLGSAEACANLVETNTGGSDKHYLTLTKDATDTSKNDIWNMAMGTAGSASKNKVYANKAIIKTNNAITISGENLVELYLKNSVLSGDLKIINSTRSFTHTLNFDGNYQGNSDSTLKGYAFVGSLDTQNNLRFYANFKNNANMKGDIKNTGGWQEYSTTNIIFTNSSLEGDINYSQSTAPAGYNLRDFHFQGNSDKGFAFKGKYSFGSGTESRGSDQTLWFEKGAKWESSDGKNSTQIVQISAGTNRFYFSDGSSATGRWVLGGGASTITLANNVKLDGSEISTYNTTNLTINASNNSEIKADIKISGSYATQTIRLDNSKIIGKMNAVGSTTSNFQLNNKSSITGDINNESKQMDITLQGKSSITGNITFKGTKNTFTANDSTLTGKLSTTKDSEITFANSSTIKGGISLNSNNTLEFVNSTFDGTKLDSTESSFNASLLTYVDKSNTVSFTNSMIKGEGNISAWGTDTFNLTDTVMSSGVDFSLDGASAASTTINAKNSTLTNITTTPTDKSQTLTAVFDNTSVGNIINSSTSSSLTFLNTAGKTIGNITGNIGSEYKGSITGVFDFRKTKSDTTLTMGNITSATDSKHNMIFIFGGVDKDGNVVDKPTTQVKITGSTKEGLGSYYGFEDIGTLDFSDGDPLTHKNILNMIIDKTNISVSNPAATLGLTKTNIILASKDTITSKIADTAFQQDEPIIAQNTKLTGLSATFGNATIKTDKDGNHIVVANNADNPSDINSFYTLSQKGETHSSNYVAGKTSDANIGFINDGFKKDVTFAFTPNTFKVSAGESGYTGNIYGGTTDSNYNFYNAGLLSQSQFKNALGHLNLYGTSIDGIIGKTYKKDDGTQTFAPVNLSFDYSPDNALVYGTVIVGQGQHNLSFDFTDNTNEVKFAGSILGGSATDSNSLSVYNLQGLMTKVLTDGSGGNDIGTAFNNAGFIAFNNKTPQKSTSDSTLVDGFSEVIADDKKDITAGTKITLAGSSFNGSLKESKYSLNFIFDTSPKDTDYTNYKGLHHKKVDASYFKGDYIYLKDNTYAQSFTFKNAGSLLAQNAANNEAVVFTFGSGKTDLRFENTDGTVAFKENAGNKSTLYSTGTNIIGDFKGDTQAIFGDVGSTHSKFFGTLENTADSKLDVTFNPNSFYSAKDSVVIKNYSDAATKPFPTVKFAATNSSNNILNINNPGGTLKIEGLTKDITLASGTKLIANNTSIIGDIFASVSGTDGSKIGNTFANLTFDTTGANKTYYKGDNISLLANGSALTFRGKGSIQPMSPSTTDMSKNMTTITLAGNASLNLTLNNTGAMVDVVQDGAQTGWNAQGNFFVKGTNLVVSKGLQSNDENIDTTMIFAKSSTGNENSQLKTSDGSLITDMTTKDGKAKSINDYVLPSTLILKDNVNLRGGSGNFFAFIGDSSIAPLTSSPVLTLSRKAKATIILLNMGNALTMKDSMNTDTSAEHSMADKLFANNNGGGSDSPYFEYYIYGSNIKNALVQATKRAESGSTSTVKVSYNAVFDNRILQDRDDDYQKYWSHALVIGSTKVEKTKSSLSGTLTLGSSADEQSRITAHLSFYGGGSFGNDAKVIGGNSDSTFLLDGQKGYSIDMNTAEKTPIQQSIKFDAFKQFNGSVNIINTSMSSNIEDKAGATSSTGLTDTDKSSFKSAQLTFNGTTFAKPPVLDTTTPSTPDATPNTLSEAGAKFVQNNILPATKDEVGKATTLDLTTKHQFTGQIGYTTSALTINFVGTDSINGYAYTKSSDSYTEVTPTSGFKISNDNAKNVYNFIDFGLLDLKLFSATGEVNGAINWIGNTYALGKINSSLGTQDQNQVIDFDHLANKGIADNIYQADKGEQHIVFEFGGSTLKEAKNANTATADDYKMTGHIIDGSFTKDSSYTFSALGTLDVTALSDSSKSFTDILNNAINPINAADASKKPIQTTKGTLGVKDTIIKGDLVLNTITSDKHDYAFDFTNAYSLMGDKISGNAEKKFSFTGDHSFRKNTLIITEGTKDSNYIFQDVGSLNTAMLDRLINGFNVSRTKDTTKGDTDVIYTKGNFSFRGDTTLVGDIRDTLNDGSKLNVQTSMTKDQTIDINGAKVVGLDDDGLGTISTITKVNAKFGVGSRVNIQNRNKDSVYDFSLFANTAPVVANINLNTNGTDGIAKATIKGFDGSTTLIGAINDIDILSNTTPTTGDATAPTKPTIIAATNNQYTFGQTPVAKDPKVGGKWFVTADSTVKTLNAYNKDFAAQAQAVRLSSKAALADHSVSFIDLRGYRAFGDDKPNTQVSGAVLNGATGDLSSFGGTNSNTYHNLTVTGPLAMAYSLLRMGVDTDAGIGDSMDIGNALPAVGNKLQVFLEKGELSGFKPIDLVRIQGDVRDNYFVAQAYDSGLYTITPVISLHKQDASGNEITQNEDYKPTTGTLNSNVSRTNFVLDAFLASADLEKAAPIQNTLGSFYRGFRIATNNLNLRMGELRGGSSTQGAWARIINGLGSDKSNNQDFYTTIQAGYDYGFDVAGGVNYLGVDAEATLLTSKGTGYSNSGRNLGLGIYNTYIMDNGFYVDASAKYLNLSQRIGFKEADLSSPSDTQYSNAFLLGGEIGYRYGLDTLMTQVFKAPKNIYSLGYFIEPQLELIYGYIGESQYNGKVGGVNYTATLKADNALISRVGAVLGKSFKTNTGLIADVRIGLSYINEINTGGNTSIIQTGSAITPAIVASTPSNNKLNLSLGTNIKFNDSWRMYADISRTFLGVYNFDYNLNIGARFSFGNKQSARAQRIKAQQEQQKHNLSQTQKEINELNKTKQTYKMDSKAKTGCQGCAPERGYYLEVAVLTKPDAQVIKYFEKYSYRAMTFMYKDNKGATLQATRYLIGPFKNVESVSLGKPQVDKLVQEITKNPKSYSVMWEVK